MLFWLLTRQEKDRMGLQLNHWFLGLLLGKNTYHSFSRLESILLNEQIIPIINSLITKKGNHNQRTEGWFGAISFHIQLNEFSLSYRDSPRTLLSTFMVPPNNRHHCPLWISRFHEILKLLRAQEQLYLPPLPPHSFPSEGLTSHMVTWREIRSYMARWGLFGVPLLSSKTTHIHIKLY